MEREEILKHKWIESQKRGFDVGFEWALIDWMVHYRHDWRRSVEPLVRKALQKV